MCQNVAANNQRDRLLAQRIRYSRRLAALTTWYSKIANVSENIALIKSWRRLLLLNRQLSYLFDFFFWQIITLGHILRLTMFLELEILPFNMRKNSKMLIADHFEMWVCFFEKWYHFLEMWDCSFEKWDRFF